jgi:hypothetical protein
VTWSGNVHYFFYTSHGVRYYDMIFDDIRQSTKMIEMTGSAILGWYNAVAPSPLTLPSPILEERMKVRGHKLAIAP